MGGYCNIAKTKCLRLYLLVTLPLNPIAAIIAHTAAVVNDVSLGISMRMEHDMQLL